MNDLHVLAYYADDPTRTYQLVQWLEVLEILHAHHPVGLVVRDPDVARLLQERTDLAVLTAPTFPELTALYDELDAKVALYCNNSILNFQSLVNGRMLHVHINHGESDKQSMASNNAKAYDRVFVAGEAAVQRHVEGLLEFDTAPAGADRAPPARPAPGPAAARRARVVRSSTPRPGRATRTTTTTRRSTRSAPASSRAILAVPDVRLVYKPHPKVTTSLTPAVQEAHLAILQLVAAAAEREPEAGHTSVLRGDILAVMPDCDAMVTDVSSVGPRLALPAHRGADPDHRPAPATPSASARRCRSAAAPTWSTSRPSTASPTSSPPASTTTSTTWPGWRCGTSTSTTSQVGDSTTRFLEAVDELVALRDRLLASRLHGDAITA